MKHNFPRIKAFSLLLAVGLLSACDQTTEQKQSTEKQAAKVGYYSIQAQSYTLTSQLPGRTSAYRVAEVRPQVNGIIQKRLFVEGSEVKEGQQLYQIDPAVYDAALKSAEASHISASSLAERYQSLVEDKAVSRQQYDDARAASLQAEAALERARIDLRYTRVLAPISGRIGRSSVTEGALVNSGQPQEMAVIQQLDPIYVDVTQSANELLRLRRELDSGQLERASDSAAQVSLKLQDGTDYPHHGRLEFSEVSVDPDTGTVTLRAVFPNPDGLLLPGMFVHANLISGVNHKAILAPQQGVTRNLQGKPTALVLNANNIAELRILQAERTSGSYWLVTEGLQEGDRLITEGLQWISQGEKADPYPAKNVDHGTPNVKQAQ